MPTSLPTVALAAGRCVVGAGAFVAPSLLGRGMGLDRRTAERTSWLARMFAVRDLALGIGVLSAVQRAARPSLERPNPDRPDLDRPATPEVRSLLLLGALCDAGDAVAMVTALRAGSTRRLPALATLATALTAAVVGAVEATR